MQFGAPRWLAAGDGEDVDGGDAGLEELFGAGVEGGAGGHDIVDQQDMFVLCFLTGPDDEGVLQVLLTLAATQVGLRRRPPMSLQQRLNGDIVELM